MEFEGIVLPIDKERGVLSSRVVNTIKRVLKKEKVLLKVGHGGTLDKFASGLLLLLIGKATKLFDVIKQFPKTYIATIKFGEFRYTDDIYGEVISYFDTSKLSFGVVSKTLKDFQGEILQVPPVYSAVHIDGTRAYKRAKKDYYSTLKKLKPKRVNIYKIELLDFQKEVSEARILVECSGGTYIRSIARDLGQILGVGGFLKDLRRTKIGNIDLDSSIKVYDIKSFADISSKGLKISDFININKNFIA
ncbi:MAG: tRNA pseudouridine(55) synthase TruB [Brevinematia bacterium]